MAFDRFTKSLVELEEDVRTDAELLRLKAELEQLEGSMLDRDCDECFLYAQNIAYTEDIISAVIALYSSLIPRLNI